MPGAVRDAAARHLGEVNSVADLGGLSGARVARLDGPAGSLVAKGVVHPRERAFYEAVDLPGVRVPKHLATVEADGTWLLLEHLAEALPRSRWGADDQVLSALHALHATDPAVLAPIPGPFRPGWPDAMDASARQVLDLSGAAEAALDLVREAAIPLFEPLRVISGDTNALNWRLDHGGQPVLLDWERIGLGHPAIDLGILLPGLPTRVAATSLATAYGGGITADQLLVAKAWSVVEFAAEAAEDAARQDAITGLREQLEPWLLATATAGRGSVNGA